MLGFTSPPRRGKAARVSCGTGLLPGVRPLFSTQKHRPEGPAAPRKTHKLKAARVGRESCRSRPGFLERTSTRAAVPRRGLINSPPLLGDVPNPRFRKEIASEPAYRDWNYLCVPI